METRTVRPDPVLAPPPTSASTPAQAAAGQRSESTPERTDATAPADIWQRLRKRFHFREVAHPRIDAELARLRRHPRSLQALLRRARPYLAHIAREVEERDLPGELALLPAVESGFLPYAYSPNGAAGLWQFMPTTATQLGLRQNRWYDGRRDIAASTPAALRYLQQLRRQLDGDWLHALAAYNCGIGTLKAALRKARRQSRSTRYWDLDLPGETNAYVPRLLALARIVDDPERHGIQLPEISEDNDYQQVVVNSSLDLEVAARLAEMPLDEFLAINPAFRRGVTPPRQHVRLLLPADRKARFEQGLKALPRDQWLRWTEHRIVRGDTLGGIARRYRVSIASIREANGIHGSRIRAGKTLRIPLSGKASDLRRGIASHGARSRLHYRVRKGDSLYTIARKFSVSIRDLRRWNRIERYLYPGQKLTVYLDHSG